MANLNLTKKHRLVLDPFGKIMWEAEKQIEKQLQSMTAKELRLLEEACGRANNVNCWYASKRAVDMLGGELDHLLQFMRNKAKDES